MSAAELTWLVARAADIKTFINNGGGLFASAECYPCGADLAGNAANLFAYLPVTVTSIGANAPFTVTPYGQTLGLTGADLNDPTHNSFGLVGGLKSHPEWTPILYPPVHLPRAAASQSTRQAPPSPSKQ